MVPVHEGPVRPSAGIQRSPDAVQELSVVGVLSDCRYRCRKPDEGNRTDKPARAPAVTHRAARAEQQGRGEENAECGNSVCGNDTDRKPDRPTLVRRRRQPQRGADIERVRRDSAHECAGHGNQLNEQGRCCNRQHGVESPHVVVGSDVTPPVPRQCCRDTPDGNPHPGIHAATRECDAGKQNRHRCCCRRRGWDVRPRLIERNSSCTCSRNIASNSTCCARYRRD